MDGEPELAYNSFFFKSALVLQRHSVYAFLSYLSIMKTLLYFYASVFFRMFYMMLVRYKRSSRKHDLSHSYTLETCNLEKIQEHQEVKNRNGDVLGLLDHDHL